MERAAGCLSVCVVAMFSAMLLHSAAGQTVHVVGDTMGWDIPTNSSVSYDNWASGRTFRVGDILVFNFMTNQHDLVEVPQASYNACSQDNAIGNVITTGPANITLSSAGGHYYICTFGRHCQSGQRLSITVVSSTPGGATPPVTSTPPPTRTTTPAPATPQSDACAPTTPNARGPAAALSPLSPPPTTDSASTSPASTGYLFALLSAAIGFMF